jgi:hypothetical protein
MCSSKPPESEKKAPGAAAPGAFFWYRFLRIEVFLITDTEAIDMPAERGYA